MIGEVIEPRARRAAELAELDRRLAAEPADPEAFHRAWVLSRQLKWREAIPDLERGLKLRPDDPDGLFLLALAHINLSNHAAALAALEKYLAHAADDIDARFAKARVALTLNRFGEAVDDFTRVLDVDPNRDQAHANRAQARFRLGRYQESLADLDPLIEHYSSDPVLLALRSQVHDRLGHKEQAQSDWKRSLGSPLVTARDYNNQAWTLANGPKATRDPDQALVLARKAVALTPDTAIYLNTLGTACLPRRPLCRGHRNARKEPGSEQGRIRRV